jgi:1-acyl-sn-glycerol-3-phosphate acyltransferase
MAQRSFFATADVFVRSLVFNAAFYGLLIVWLSAGLPLFLAKRSTRQSYIAVLNRNVFWLMRVICRLNLEVVGRDNIPAGKLLVASKHQSAIDNFIVWSLFRDPTYILKRELRWVPLLGWWIKAMRMIPVDRGGGPSVHKALNKCVAQELAEDRQVMIFPEGTRKVPGSPPDYKRGVALLYVNSNAPCLPVALDTGLYWPRRKFMRYPGTIKVEILPAIEPGMKRDDFLALLQERVETACNKMLIEAQSTAS